MEVILNVKMPEEEKKALLDLAINNDRTMSSMVRVLIKEQIKRSDLEDDNNE